MSEFTHFNRQGEAVMVDVSAKTETAREAVAEGRISMSRECFEKVKEGEMGKGDVLGVARVAGIMGAKKTSELIPLCHLLHLTKVEISFELEEETSSVRAACTVRTTGRTGVEMDEGEIVGELDPKATTQEELGLYMAGAKRDEVRE